LRNIPRVLKILALPGIALLFLMNMGSSPSAQAKANAYGAPYYVEQVADIAAGADDSDPAWFTIKNEALYFQAKTKESGAELWKYSHLTREAMQVRDINAGSAGSKPEWLTVYGNDIYFAATDATHGRQLWKYNTVAGTARMVVDLGNYPSGSDPRWLQIVGSTLYFNAVSLDGRELYAYFPETGKSQLVKNINPLGDSNPEYLYGYYDILYFTADDGRHGREPWRSDGTINGTTMIKDIYDGVNSSEPSSFNMLGDMLIFSANDGVHEQELWQSYGSKTTTKMIKDIEPGSDGSDPGWSNRLGDSVIFFPAKTNKYGNELWRYDMQHGAYLLADINDKKKDSNPAAIGSVGWEMFFSADDGKTGVELWKTEPPYEYAYQVSDINPGKRNANPKPLGVMGTTLFFTANDGIHGEEVWYSEFPHYKTFLLKDIRTGSRGSTPEFTSGGYVGSISNSIRSGWTIYFTANDGRTGTELWQISTGALPSTGFAPRVKTNVPEQPARLEYQSYDQLTLEIPKLGKLLSITGVPKDGNSWNLDWLGANEVGYLSGTTFPTQPGNTAITGHVYLADGSPGPFVDLGKLSWDDKIIIHAWGKQYIYSVRYKNERVDPNDSSILDNKDYSWITLITCKDYNESTGFYRWRTVVQAVLVEVVDE